MQYRCMERLDLNSLDITVSTLATQRLGTTLSLIASILEQRLGTTLSHCLLLY